MNPLSSKVHFLAQTRQTKRRTNRTENHHEQISAPESRACADVFQLCIEAFCLRMLRGALLMRKTAGMRRAENREITVVFFLFALYNSDESVEKSKYVCSVCKKKSQLSPFQKAKAYKNDVESSHRRTGKSFHHVGAVSSYFLTFCLPLSANAFFSTFKRSDAGSLE